MESLRRTTYFVKLLSDISHIFVQHYSAAIFMYKCNVSFKLLPCILCIAILGGSPLSMSSTSQNCWSMSSIWPQTPTLSSCGSFAAKPKFHCQYPQGRQGPHESVRAMQCSYHHILPWIIHNLVQFLLPGAKCRNIFVLEHLPELFHPDLQRY